MRNYRLIFRNLAFWSFFIILSSVEAYTFDTSQGFAYLGKEETASSRKGCSFYLSRIEFEELKFKQDIEGIDLNEFSHFTYQQKYPIALKYKNDDNYHKLLTKENLSNIWEEGDRNSPIWREGLHQPWVFMLSPDLKIRETTISQKRFELLGYLKNNQDLKSYLKETQNKYTALKVNNISMVIKKQFENIIDFEKSFLNSVKPQVFSICTIYNPKLALKCSRAVNDIIKQMKPSRLKNPHKEGINLVISHLPLMEKVLSEKVYYEAVNIAAVKVLSHINNGLNKGDHLFKDIFDSFLEIGEDSESAFEKTWDIIGFYSTRGANIRMPLLSLVGPEISDFALSMEVIALGMNILDLKVIDNGSQYSLPPSIVKSFDNPKPYHFWMTAFFARKQAQKFEKPEVGQLAAYLVNLAYQMKAETPGRKPYSIFEEKNFSHTNNKMRFDIVYAGAGAKFGSGSIRELNNKVIKLDQTLIKMIQKSELKEPLTYIESRSKWKGTGLDGYFRWKEIIKPDYVLEM